IGLPGINGYEATHSIKSINPNLKVIAQTAYVSEQDRKKAFKAGCDDFLSKPLSKKSLLAVVSKHLNGHNV
ncbi:MAG TPA: response regulator, partial [Draconibacterium sp.]|nr:response regulator [Draconibacterium sp.]